MPRARIEGCSPWGAQVELYVFRKPFGTSLHLKLSTSIHGIAEVSGRVEARGKLGWVETSDRWGHFKV